MPNSRGVSPSPVPSYPSSANLTDQPPPRPTRAPLRVITDPSLSTLSSLRPSLPPNTATFPHTHAQDRGHTMSARLRSNSVQSHSQHSQSQLSQHYAPPYPHGAGMTGSVSNQFARSLSQNTVELGSPPSPPSAVVGGEANVQVSESGSGGGMMRRNDDVAMAVNGLRGNPISTSPVDEQDDGVEDDEEARGGSTSGELQRKGENDAADDLAIRRIYEALGKSNDQGDTLDLSRRGIERIGEDAVEMFRRGVGKERKGVWRLALSYNLLRDQSIVDSFSRLSRLRYLNLKGNRFTEFPPALSDMMALEILDLSKNSIDAFPERPGRLAQLKVLSLTSNRISALPGYLTTFSHLKVFKVNQNPIEWPPREVLGSLIDNESNRDERVQPGKSRKEEDLRPWIENMKSWMRQRALEGERLLVQNKDDDVYLTSEGEPKSAPSTDGSNSESHHWRTGSQSSLVLPISRQSSQQQDEREQAISPSKQRPLLIHRNRSATMSEESVNRPSSVDLFLPPNRPFARHDRSTSTSSYTPPQSASTASSSSHSRAPSTQLPLLPPAHAQLGGHSRGSSFTASQRLSAGLAMKKSLPDLRMSHAKIMQDRRADQVEPMRTLGLGIKTIPQSPKRYGASAPSVWAESPVTPERPRPISLLRKGSAEMLRVGMGSNSGTSANRDSAETPSANESRDSYFRRLSTLPKSTISKAIPTALLKFMDAIRGILFALSQLHSALRQYLLFAAHDRIAGVFTRVMEPAGTYMNNLINALDRFDSMSRRATPPVSAIKAVIDATKESVAVFGKVVAVLRLQMPALRGGDVRYTRTLLLMIYGSMAEVACSWDAMAPLMSEIKPLLTDPVQRMMGGLGMVATGSMTGRTPISPIPERGESRSPSSIARSSVSTINASPHPAQTTAVTSAEVPAAPPTPTAVKGSRRRQAGSFSMEDVEKGMLMGSPGAPSETSLAEETRPPYNRHRPSESAQIVLEDQTEESENEEETLMPLPMPPFAKSSRSGSTTGIPMTPPELSQHPQLIGMVPTNSRRGHHPSSSAGSLSAGMSGPLRKLSVDVRPPTPASATLYDEDLLDVIETATDIAFTVWLKLAEDINASSSATSPVISLSTISHQKSASQSSLASTVDSIRPSSRPDTISPKFHSELVLLLSHAEQITTALRESLAGLRANPLTWNYTSLPEDAQAFIKTVVKVSELVKIISAGHTFPQGVRQSCSKLTQATRECAILIQVSSLRPGASTPAVIPTPLPMSARPMSPAYRHVGLGNGSANGHGQHGAMGSSIGSGSVHGGTAASSAEDLTAPHSAGWMGMGLSMTHMNSSGGGSGSGGGGGGMNSSASSTFGRNSPAPGSGLRGLQLPGRYAARKYGSGGNAREGRGASGHVAF